MVKIKGKTPKQYFRDYYEQHPELKEKRRERYQLKKKNKTIVINVEDLIINAKNVTIVEN